MTSLIPENKAIEGTEKKFPLVILVDTSGSMISEQDKLIEGLNELKWNLSNDEKACSSTELCIITFNNDARVAEPFGPVSKMIVPDIHCRGLTAMHAAVDTGLQAIEKHLKEYRENGVSYYRPMMYLLTDGEANDPDSGAFDRLRQLQKDKKISFFPVAVGEDVNKEMLCSFRPDHVIFTVDRGCISKAFDWFYENCFTTPVGAEGGMNLSDPEDEWIEEEIIQIDVD